MWALNLFALEEKLVEEVRQDTGVHLGDNGLGESLSSIGDVRREPLEYIELSDRHELAVAARVESTAGTPLWARRACSSTTSTPRTTR